MSSVGGIAAKDSRCALGRRAPLQLQQHRERRGVRMRESRHVHDAGRRQRQFRRVLQHGGGVVERQRAAEQPAVAGHRKRAAGAANARSYDALAHLAGAPLVLRASAS